MNSFELHLKFDDARQDTAEVYVNGEIQGESCRFLLDTGCARTSLNFDEFSSRLEKVGSDQSSGIFGRTDYDLVSVRSIELGPILKRDVTLSRAKAGELDRKLFGIDLLKDTCLHFSFERNLVEVNPDVHNESITFYELELDKGNIPYINLQCGDAKTKAVWDTGASITLVDLGFIERNSQFFKRIGSDTGTDTTGSKMETPLYLMGSVVIGDKQFPPHKVVGVDLSHVNAATEMPMSFILGYSTLSKANWLFDFPNKKWAIHKMIGN